MSLWNNKTIPFWQEKLVFPNSFPILISEGKDYRTGWPESFKPTMTEIINELSKSRTSYIRLDSKGDRISISILSGKIIVSCNLSLEKNKVGIKGPMTTPIGTGFRSANVFLRKKYDLFANVRPVKSLGNVKSKFNNIDITIFRENTEDIYAGIEFSSFNPENS